jgi:hypothetical protein
LYQGAPEPLLNEAERAIAVAADVACTAAAARASEDSQAIRHKAEGAKACGHHPGWQPGQAEIAAEGGAAEGPPRSRLGRWINRAKRTLRRGPSTPHTGHDQHGCGHAGWAGTPSVAQGNAVGIDVLAAQDCQLVAEDQDLDLVGVRRPPPQHHQLEKAVQRQVDERPDHPHLQRDDSTRRRTIALLITPTLNPRN